MRNTDSSRARIWGELKRGHQGADRGPAGLVCLVLGCSVDLVSAVRIPHKPASQAPLSPSLSRLAKSLELPSILQRPKANPNRH